ncbi:MAG: spermidine/putrescine ABC transporter substrate-binding protein [Clostridia bacterium]|nr:spermidine/putrescine ABC transporter substrate-binding protein [Clostridia bacterium]
MKKVLCIALFLMMLIPVISIAQEEKALNIYTWEEYIDDDTIRQFSDETGIKVNYAPMGSNDEMVAILQQNGGSEYDIIIASDYVLNTLRKEGLLKKLNKEALPNYVNLNPDYLSKFYDPDNEYVIPYMAGTPLIVYDPDRVSIEITGYGDLWDPSLKDAIVMIDDARVIIGITLKTLGYSFNVTDPDILNQAKEKLFSLYQNIHAFDYDTPYNVLLSGGASVAFMFTPQVKDALDGNPNLVVVYPVEGMGYGIDNLVIPVNAPHPNNAEIFLNFLMDPQVAAQCALAQNYMNPNKAAEAFLPEEFLTSPVLYIAPEILGDPEFIEDVGEMEGAFQEIWTEFKMQ